MNLIKRIITSLKVRLLKNGLDKHFWKINYRKEELFLNYHKYNKEGLEHLKKEERYKAEGKLPFYNFYKNCLSQYLYTYKSPVIVEPYQGWLIDVKDKKLFSRSFPYINNPYSSEKAKPQTLKFFNPFKKIIEVEEAISIRYYWQNYYHFFFDTLPQLHLADQLKISKEIPVVIPSFVKNINYVKDFLQLSSQMEGRKIIWQQSNEFIRVNKKTYLLKNYTYPKDALEATLLSFKDHSFLSNIGNRKVYLKRASHKKRALHNNGEVEAYLKKRGYEVIDSENMSLQQQIDLFSNVSEIIGLHGAGLTNIIFRNGRPLKLIEIFPDKHQPEFYRVICKMFGFKYCCIIGGQMNSKQQFSLPLEKLDTFFNEKA